MTTVQYTPLLETFTLDLRFMGQAHNATGTISVNETQMFAGVFDSSGLLAQISTECNYWKQVNCKITVNTGDVMCNAVLDVNNKERYAMKNIKLDGNSINDANIHVHASSVLTFRLDLLSHDIRQWLKSSNALVDK